MDWLTFISHVISSLVWPLTVVILALLFRAELVLLFREVLPALLQRAKGLKAGPVKLDLYQGLELLKGAERKIPPLPVPGGSTVLTLTEISAAHPPAGIPRVMEGATELVAEEPVAEAPVLTTPKNLAPADLMATSWQRLRRTLIQKAHAAGDTRVRSVDSAVASLVAKGKGGEGFEDAFDQVRLVYQQTRGQPADAALAREFAKACERLLEHLAETAV